MRFHLIDNRHVAIALEFFEVASNEISEFFDGVTGAVDFFPKTLKGLFGLEIKKLNQNVVFVFEIQIYGTVGDTGFFGDLRNGRLVVSLAGEHLYGSFQDASIFVVFFSGSDV
jgi:hypothetical protein